MTERDRVLIEIRRHPLTGEARYVTSLGELGTLQPERDPRIPADWLPDQPDPENAGYGYTGRLRTPVPGIILVAGDTFDQIVEWQSQRQQPWPYSGVKTSIRRLGQTGPRVMTIEALNGTWSWRLAPAYWPDQHAHRLGTLDWWVGVGV
ncbi:hypothetical protein [Mycobacterium aquaticum]|uniref:Uncharacterized protein n=1 Tax=Mycobacterium aquaticum TaxID=1927124 RepID=A0A1X0A4A0_9MYCO|nr:hypothetical protein [Mycobacterium aquaticum]ORA24903.1 hypothetical protein BST13_33580 [Mycobacterium aquaticum]